MAVLTGHQIVELVRSNFLGITPFELNGVQSASYDLKLHHKILVAPVRNGVRGKVIDLRGLPDGFEISPRQMISILSLEKLNIPLNITGRFGIRSHFARKGLIAFGGLQLDPGFRGRLIMNLSNVGPLPVVIKYSEHIFSVEFSRLETCSFCYSGEFQDQDDFPKEQFDFIINRKTSTR
jgi:dCTP deaminase